jgi:tRNA pseudouridine38-40 synthase
MTRYFLEVAYKGTNYSGFQVQENANTIQAEVEKAFAVIQRQAAGFTGSSRTDAGVHATQNFFHFDFEESLHPQLVYKMNSLLPGDIVVKKLYPMPGEAHSRFDAIARAYNYNIHIYKDPFLQDRSYFFPYKLNMHLLFEAASYVKTQQNFFGFSKTNTQVKNFNCHIYRSEWALTGDTLIYRIEGNRFLRGMVRLLTASILKVAREKISLEEFKAFFDGNSKCGFSIPAHGLFLEQVKYPEGYFDNLEFGI